MIVVSLNKAVHGALRRDLERFEEALRDFPDRDRRRARRLRRAWRNYEDQLRHHHESEREHAWPVLTSLGVDPDALCSVDAGYAELEPELVQARTAMAEMRGKRTADAAAAAHRAVHAVSQVLAPILEDEEAATEPVYRAKQESSEIRQMQLAQSKVSPARAGRFFAWVTDGATEAEMVTLRRQAPSPLLLMLAGRAIRRYQRDVASLWRE